MFIFMRIHIKALRAIFDFKICTEQKFYNRIAANDHLALNLTAYLN